MNDPGISRSLEIVLGVVVSTVAAILILLTLMTRPGIGTPVTNWALGVWGPEGATISRAHKRFPGLTTVVFSDFEAPGTAEISSGAVRISVLGFLSGRSWISRADMEDGYFARAPDLKGTVYGEFNPEGRGDAFREAAANLYGRISVWSENAELLAPVAEAAALDIFQTLALIDEREDEETCTPTRCAVSSLAFENCVSRTDPALVDTADRRVLVTGQIGLQQEALDSASVPAPRTRPSAG